MKLLAGVCLAGSLLICPVSAQEPPKPALRKGVHVQLPVAGHPAEMREADDPNATVVAITADGKVFLGINRTEPAALSSLNAPAVYVKTDARTPFQYVLAVLDALRGKSVVLLTEPPGNVGKTGTVAPYGIRLMVPR